MPLHTVAQPVLASHVGTTRLGVEDWQFASLIPLHQQHRLVCDGCGAAGCVVLWSGHGAAECADCLQHDDNLPVVLVEYAGIRPCRHCGASLRPNRALPGTWEAQAVEDALCTFGARSVHDPVS